jgi:hypothetical protein
VIQVLVIVRVSNRSISVVIRCIAMAMSQRTTIRHIEVNLVGKKIIVHASVLQSTSVMTTHIVMERLRVTISRKSVE